MMTADQHQPSGEGSRRRRNSGLPRVIDVAAAAGVSHQTVSRVLNGSTNVTDETRCRVQAAIAQLGYRRNHAAHVLASMRSRWIGLLVTELDSQGPAAFGVALHEALTSAGFDVILSPLNDLEPRTVADAVGRMRELAVEVLIVTITHRSAVAAVAGLARDIPVVVISGERSVHPFSVGVDNAEGARLATHHLLELGHPAVALVSGPLQRVDAMQREIGWREAHAAYGVRPGRRWQGNWTTESGYRAGKRLAQDRSVTAAFVANDQMALGVLVALSEAGRPVPEDVSIVGFQDAPAAAFLSPPLTTVQEDHSQLAAVAVETVVHAIAGDRPTIKELVQPRLVIRRSTASFSEPRYEERVLRDRTHTPARAKLERIPDV